MSQKPPLSQNFMDSIPYLMHKASKQKQLQVILYILKDYPDQFEEFIEKFGIDKFYSIMPRA